MDIITFVCTGNTCRSPMAEAIFNSKYANANIKAISCGINAIGESISKNSINCLINNNINLDESFINRKSLSISKEILEESKLIYCISISHYNALNSIYPEFEKKFRLLPYNVPDPYMQSQKVYNECYKLIDYNLSLIFNKKDFYSIKKAELSDIDRINLIEKERFNEPWSYTSFISSFNSSVTNILVAKDNFDNLLGFIVFTNIGDESEILDIAIEKSFENLGIASKLFDETFNILKSNNCSDIYLDVRTNNLQARHLYEKLGFSQINIRKNYYHNPNEDAIVMKKQLGD